MKNTLIFCLILTGYLGVSLPVSAEKSSDVTEQNPIASPLTVDQNSEKTLSEEVSSQKNDQDKKKKSHRSKRKTDKKKTKRNKRNKAKMSVQSKNLEEKKQINDHSSPSNNEEETPSKSIEVSENLNDQDQ